MGKLKIGITGGIGSGKTTVCQVFEQLGIPVYYADQEAKGLMHTDPVLIASIKELFGEEVYLPNGNLRRDYVARIVFDHPEKLSALNALVHPAVRKHGKAWHKRQKKCPYTLKEAAILFESGGAREMDKVICVYAPKEVRIRRVITRDQMTREKIEARIDQQWPELKKMMLADFIVLNDGHRSVIRQVLKIHKELVQVSKG